MNNILNKKVKNILFVSVFIIFTKYYVFAQAPISNFNFPWSVSSIVNKNSDENFALEAANFVMIEMEMSIKGESKTTHPLVKKFAYMMIRDHTIVNEELKSIMIAKNKSVVALDSHNMTKKKLENKTGIEYDMEFMRLMIEEHNKDIDLFENESRNGKDTAFKNFATKILPLLKIHLDVAKEAYSLI